MLSNKAKLMYIFKASIDKYPQSILMALKKISCIHQGMRVLSYVYYYGSKGNDVLLVAFRGWLYCVVSFFLNL